MAYPQPPLCLTRNLSFLSLLDNDQVRIGDIQRRAILGEFHFNDILLPSFPRKTSEKFEYVLLCILSSSLSCARSARDSMALIPNSPVCAKQRIIATAVLRVEPVRSNSHQALHLIKLERLFDLKQYPVPVCDDRKLRCSDGFRPSATRAYPQRNICTDEPCDFRLKQKAQGTAHLPSHLRSQTVCFWISISCISSA
jgi:hypothetical protein